MPADFVPKPRPYVERLQKAQRILRSAQFRSDQRLAIRELCEALNEFAAALLEREQGPGPSPDPGNAETADPK